MRYLGRQCNVALRIVSLSFRARLEYRAEFVLAVLAGVFWQTSVLVFASILVTRFPGMAGWSSGGILLLAGMRLLSHGLYVVIFSNLDNLSFFVQQGRIDGFMLRPLPVYRQVLLYQFNVNALGDLSVAIILFCTAFSRLNLNWTPLKIIFLVIGIIGGTLMEAAIHTVVSCLALRFPSGSLWSKWVDDIITTFGNYPLQILPGAVQRLLTFGLPVAFIAYFPASALTGHPIVFGFPSDVGALSPVAGLIAYLCARILWSRSLRYYQGIGGY